MKMSSQHNTLPQSLYGVVKPASFPETRLIYQNTAWATRLQMQDDLKNADDWIRRFGRFEAFDNSFAEPLALCYHGHQFGTYNPDLGDGRGFL